MRVASDPQRTEPYARLDPEIGSLDGSVQATAAVVRTPGGPFLLEEVELERPRATEILVEIAASGMCHTDLIARDGLYPCPLPLICGHEGTGVVREVGGHVRNLQVGDHVILTHVSCGTCENCQRGLAPYCDSMFRMNFGGLRLDGTTPFSRGGEPIYSEFMGQSSFSTHVVTEAACAVKLPPSVALDVIAPLACGVQTGAGAVANVLRPDAGSTIAIFGAGTVGLSATMIAAAVGCSKVIVVDVRESRLAIAGELGATHQIDAGCTSPVEEIQRITGGGGVHFSIEASGIPAVFRQAVDCLRETGVCALVGAAPYGAEARLDMTTLLRGRTIRGVIYGNSTPGVFIPRLIEMHRAGKLPFDRFVQTFPLSAINEAARLSEQGDVVKPVLLMS